MVANCPPDKLAPKMDGNILLIDDEQAVRDVVAEMFRRRGVRVHMALDGMEGLEAAKKLRPKLILLDFEMPRLNGLQTLKVLKADTDLRDIPVVMLSGSGTLHNKMLALRAGAAWFLDKPFSPKILLELVEQIFDPLSAEDSP